MPVVSEGEEMKPVIINPKKESQNKPQDDLKNPFNNERVVTFLEQNAFYPKNEMYFQDSEKAIFDEIKNHYKPGKKILIYGCGTGRDLDILMSLNVEIKPEDIILYDPSQAMIDKAKQKFPAYSFTSINPLVNTGVKFGIALCNNVLQHQANTEEQLKIITEISDSSEYSFFHFWYADNNQFKPVVVRDIKINEYWIGKRVLTNMLNSFKYNAYIHFYGFQKPYKCVTVEIRNHAKQKPDGKNPGANAGSGAGNNGGKDDKTDKK